MQAAAPQLYDGSHAAAGVSSFGMSGVNAHAVFGASRTAEAQQEDPLTWKHNRHWPVPPRHYFLKRAKWEGAAGVCRYRGCVIDQPTAFVSIVIFALQVKAEQNA